MYRSFAFRSNVRWLNDRSVFRRTLDVQTRKLHLIVCGGPDTFGASSSHSSGCSWPSQGWKEHHHLQLACWCKCATLPPSIVISDVTASSPSFISDVMTSGIKWRGGSGLAAHRYTYYIYGLHETMSHRWVQRVGR